MDRWLTSNVKDVLIRPCIAVTDYIGERLENRFATGQEIGEPALTEDFVDRFDTRSSLSAWADAANALRKIGIYLNLLVQKSTIEHRTGTDIGLTIRRSVYTPVRASAEYAVLIQCKKVDRSASVGDFFHVVTGSGRRQSELMLSITPASYYFLYVPPPLLKGYMNMEPVGFVLGGQDIHVGVFNLGAMPMQPLGEKPLSQEMLRLTASILVVPALAVEAHKQAGAKATLEDLLPNSIPFWYWFTELLLPGFIGDPHRRTIEVAQNVRRGELDREVDFGVRYALTVSMSNG